MRDLIVVVSIALSLLVPLGVHADQTSQRAIAEDLLQTMKFEQMMTPVRTQMRSMMEQRLAQIGAPEDMQPILKRYTDRLFAVMDETLNWSTMKEDIIAIYVQVFSEDELKGMLEFYKGPVGQSAISKMPAAMQQSMALVQKRMPELQQKMKKISEELAQEIKAEREKKEKSQDKTTKKKART